LLACNVVGAQDPDQTASVWCALISHAAVISVGVTLGQHNNYDDKIALNFGLSQ